MNESLRVTLAFPGVVNIDVHISGILHSTGDHGVGGRTNCLVIHFPGKMIPTVPAHWGSRREIFLLCETGNCKPKTEGDAHNQKSSSIHVCALRRFNFSTGPKNSLAR